ncbi:MAG: glycosyltransferase [Propionibacteriaceae bacterium]|nr:glycosyltransferase [Propionibacteriaceae bacterium]
MGRALQSCLNQSLRDIEVICVDDGSTDQTPDVLAQFTQKDPRFRVITHSRRRTAFQARRTGVLAARGDYIMFLDSDDVLDPVACEKVNRVAQIDNPDVIHFGVSVIDTITRTLIKPGPNVQPRKEVLYGSAIFRDFFGSFQPNVSVPLWDKAYHHVLALEAFREQSAEREVPQASDICMSVILLASANSYRSIPDALYTCFLRSRELEGQMITDAEYEDTLNTRASYEVITEFVTGAHSPTPDVHEFLFHMRSCFIHHSLKSLLQLATPDATALKRLFDLWPFEEVLDVLERRFSSRPEALFPMLRGFKYRNERRTRKVQTIGLFVDTLGYGGVQRAIAMQASLLSRTGYSVIILTSGKKSDFPYAIPKTVKIRSISPPSDSKLQTDTAGILHELAQTLREERVDVIINHSNYRDNLLFFSLGLAVLPVQTVMTVHNFCLRSMMEFNKRFANYHRILALYDAVTALSPVDVLFWQTAGVPNVHLVANPIEAILEAHETVEDTPPDDDTTFTPVDVLWIGRLQERTKSVSEVIRVFAELRKLRPQASLRIIGPEQDRGIRGRLHRLADELQVSDAIEFMPATDQPIAALQAASVMLQTSQVEGFGYSLVEAMAARRPVVMYDLPYLTIPQGNPAIITVPWGRRDLCAREILELLNDDDKRASIAEEGYNDLRLRFSDASLLDSYQKLIVSLAPSQPGPTPDTAPTFDAASTLVSEALRLFNIVYRRETRSQEQSEKARASLNAKVEQLETEKRRLQDALRPVLAPSHRSRIKRLMATVTIHEPTSDTTAMGLGIWPLWQRQMLTWRPVQVSPFTDLSPDDHSYPYACWMRDEGLLLSSENRFEGSTLVTRRDALVALWILAGRPEIEAEDPVPFEDVPMNDPHVSAFLWATERRIVRMLATTSSQLLRPDLPLRRAPQAAFLHRAAGSPAYVAPDDSPFTDVPADHEFYRSIMWCVLQGVMSGQRQDKTILFSPASVSDRSSFAESLFSFAIGPLAVEQQDQPVAAPVLGKE